MGEPQRKPRRAPLRWWCLALLQGVVLPLHAAQPSVEWVARHAGPYGTDLGIALTLDAAGNVYVTGDSAPGPNKFDATTIKYDSQGNELWVSRYRGPLNLQANGRAIAVDSHGNVYVGGFTRGVGGPGDSDFLTIKYSPDGTEQWVSIENLSTRTDIVRELELDRAGNVYVAGDSHEDMVVIKYAASGRKLWESRYDGPAPGNGLDRVADMAVSPEGHVHVTGMSGGDGTEDDYVTIKYGPDGARAWLARYNGPENHNDRPRGIAVDQAGNVYVTGISGVGNAADAVTIKYAPDGQLLWQARYDHEAVGKGDGGMAIAVDGRNNVYVAGMSTGVRSQEIVTIKYGTDGKEQWASRYDGPGDGWDYPLAMAVDPDGDVNITGRSDGPETGTDMITIRYDTEGNEQWVGRHNGPGDGGDMGMDIALDPDGAVYVTGSSSGGDTGSDIITIKYTSPEPLAVAVDVKPRSCPNPVNIDAKGVVPVAVLGTREFDVNRIDRNTIRIEGVGPARTRIDDVAAPFEPYTGKTGANDCTDAGPDGHPDLVMQFPTQELVTAIEHERSGGVRSVRLTGALRDGTAIAGEDVVVLLSKNAKPTRQELRRRSDGLER